MARHRYSLDDRKIERFRKKGRGKGRGAAYLPWLTIRDVPSRGRSHRLQGIKTGRVHHLHSDIECNFFYLLDWADETTDIREHYPLERSATLRIAGDLSIQHPLDVATRTPWVMTTDFLIDVVRDGRLTLLARAVKPSKDLDNRRVLEKLEIERRYWLGEAVDWCIVTEADISEAAVRNIAWVHNYGSLTHLAQPYPGYLDELAARVLNELSEWPTASLGQFCADMDQRLLVESGTTLMLFRHLLARKALVCSMDERIEDSQPLHRFRVAGTEHRITR